MQLQLHPAPDIKHRIRAILRALDFPHIDAKRVICFRSHGSTSRARARIWSFPRIWQKALDLKPHYVIEVLSEKFDKLNRDDQTKILIHELMHIPKTFSGALLPHRGRGKRRIDHRSIENLFKQYKSAG
ncbi:metallopeptidase [Patescibacteria group bacterium]|nr:metallopeptidase [Patescibacteria group bacterium]